ncbi:Ppx/GppA phosphatase family protein [Campylobacter gastrosuis]|uniref:Ppx/GppA family phosphatase n=1 Tax=Campylobacter gastrosuis TaxID=2974576 RepID=A0ABT7HLW2_9BACT|nr:Ppx/GppA phosphatase family protein [Campylobacter gastrosuis]MDL0087946.1 Ppx/GppA family phosphatase [Campylobacter gastrosuis]
MAKRTAVIDIGSNSMRMVIFERTSRFAFFTLSEYKMRVRLGEGGYESGGKISQNAMQRAFLALREFSIIAKSYKCTKIFCVGTSALRDAPNSGDFISLVRSELGINLRVIDGKSEANYGAVAAKNLLCVPKQSVTIDIGGGSSELGLIKNGVVTDTISLDIGTVRLKELFFDNKKTQKVQNFIKETIKQIPSHFKCENVIAIGGSLRAISSAIMKKTLYPMPTLHGFCYKFDEQVKFIDDIAKAKIDDLENFFIKKDRFDTIREGALIFLGLCKFLGAKQIFTSGVGVREGVFLSDFLRPSLKFPANFNPSLKSLQDRFVLISNKNVAKNVRAIFHALKPLHALDDGYLYALDVASRVHNAGQDIGFYNDHINSAYIVQNALNFGFTHEQKALISAIISTNGKKVIYDYERFKRLLPKQSVVRWLSFMLALARLLDINNNKLALKFQLEGQILRIFGAKELFMAKEEIKKLIPPENFAISFES